jgi:hypothetical protein
MQDPTTIVTDIWFRSPLALGEIAAAVGLSNVREDSENYWAWVIGTLDGVDLDITRTHTRPAARVDTRIFRFDNQAFTVDQQHLLRSRLLQVVTGDVCFGRWIYLKGNDFELQVVKRTSADE